MNDKIGIDCEIKYYDKIGSVVRSAIKEGGRRSFMNNKYLKKRLIKAENDLQKE